MRFHNYSHNNVLLSFLCLILLVSNAKNIQGQTISHQKGEFYGAEDYMTNAYGKSMQKTNTYNTIVYVDPSTTTTTLNLPSKTATSPHHYYRWYNYKTDGASAQITTGGTAYTNGRIAYGGTTLLDAITYNVPSTLSSTPDIIACDVSANIDYTVSGSYLTQEPTLSYRSIYDIRSAKEIADKLKSCTGNVYLEDYTIYMPSAKITGSNEYPRVALKYNATNYFGYNSSNALVQGSYSNFALVNTNSQFTTSNTRFCYVTPGTAGTSKVVTAKITCGTLTYNVARFTIIFLADIPDLYDNLTGTEAKRSISYLDNNYVLLSKLDFDYDTDPATLANNMWSKPLSWDICSYGFSSPTLFDKGLRGFTNKVCQWNEYGFYKTANVAGITSNYTWYNGGRTVYDRRHFTSSGAQDGYFLYVDAAETPGIIAKLAIDKLCPGTKLFVSAGISSLTNGTGKSDPDLNFVFIGIDADGNETELNRYTTGDIPQATTSPTPWWQAYYSFTYNSNIDYVSYKVQIENNCLSTKGGDYAVDDIRIYRSKPSVQANQVTLPCGNENAKVKVRVEYQKLLENMSKTEAATGLGSTFQVRYKFLDDSKNTIVYNYNTSSDPDNEYGVINVSTDFSAMTAITSSNEAPLTYSMSPALAYTETVTIDGVATRFICFQTPNNETLKENKTYYTVIANSGGTFGTGTCDMISDPFIIIPPSRITVDGASWNSEDGMCYGNIMTIGANLRDRITHEDIVCRFDWYFGSKEEFETTPASGMSASTALINYRTVYPNPAEGEGLMGVSGVFTQDAYDLLLSLINTKKLVLNKKEIQRLIRYGEALFAKPIPATAVPTSTTTDLELCTDYVEIDATASHINPSIMLNSEGFDSPISLRMGLSQFNDLKTTSTKTLTIPILDFKNSDQTKIRDLIKASDTKVYLIATDDPSITNVDSLNPIIQVANLETINATVATGDVDYLVLKIPTSSISVKEGYYYRMEFSFNQVQLIGDAVPCNGTAQIYFKIVPEYLTWTGINGDNWNNDGNWKRSVKSELFKDDTYSDDNNSHGYVPMNFSKATITNTAKTPWLYNLTSTVHLANSNYSDDANKKANAATAYIDYDWMVKANGTNYDCETFYGNTCDQIYFKSQGEMRNTNFLTYNKAWVDFELTSGRWYMLTSPLKNVVAGDMYLPTVGGRQETEAFQPITFSTATNNRFNPAVYQRSWDHSSSTVFNSSGGSSDSYISANWSHVYNKVDETYTPGIGFSIRPVYGTEGTDKVLFRLPKDDLNYSYYSYDNSVTGNNTAITRTDNGKLIFEDSAINVSLVLANTTGTNNIFLVGNPFMATLDMKKFFDAHTDFERRFWLLTDNGQSAVAIASDGTLTTSGDDILTGAVAPLQSFFIEKKESVVGNPTITFTSDMTISKPSGGTLIRSANIENTSLRILSERNGYRSSILIKLKENASNSYNSNEDVPLIMDSNLSDAPTLYSMAGTKAVMINTVSSLKNIPIGIYSDNLDNVNLTFIGLENFGGKLNVYDSALDKTTEINEENCKITIPGNTHNRYFINYTNKEIGDELYKINIYAPEKSKLIVETSQSDELRDIKVYSLNGMLIREINSFDNSSKAEIFMPVGTYILSVRSQYNVETKKVCILSF
jgi:hypothetical protein